MLVATSGWALAGGSHSTVQSVVQDLHVLEGHLAYRYTSDVQSSMPAGMLPVKRLSARDLGGREDEWG